MSGLIIAGVASGSGKTTVTLALLGALARRGVAVAPFKCGPDYIDPVFHAAAAGRPCYNLDPWAMRHSTLATIIKTATRGAGGGNGNGVAITEGVMGLFDGARGGAGSTAALARWSGWPVVLVMDASGLAQSAAAVLQGFRDHDPAVHIAGVIFNRTGSRGHEQLLAEACAPLGIPVLGNLRRDANLVLPERHLGLVQAGEHPALDTFLERAATLAAATLDLDGLLALAAAPARGAAPARNANTATPLPPPGQRIAVAQDRAFAFCYRAVLDGWRRAGAEVLPFSPLADEAPQARADAVFLPGGYPELHAAQLAASRRFHAGMREAATRGAAIYGECGGYMTLGRTLVDADGVSHPMLGLLPVQTSFATPRMTLGYRRLRLHRDTALGVRGAAFRGHEFHFATVENLQETPDTPLFQVADVNGQALGASGAVEGTVFGSFLHLVDADAAGPNTTDTTGHDDG